MHALPPAAHAAALLVALALVLATSLAWVRALRLERLVDVVLALFVLGCAQAVAAVQALSLGRAVSGAGLLAVHAAVFSVTLLLGGRPFPLDLRPQLRSAWSTLRAAPVGTRLLAATTVITAAVLLFLVVRIPPNTYDSLQYHLTRAMTYLQRGSLEPYPTPDLRETVFPANAEVLILWPMAFWAHESTAGLVQWLAWVCIGPVVHGLARRLGVAAGPALLAALAFLSLPSVLLQASSTQNDLLAAAFVLCVVHFVIAVDVPRAPWLAALAIGLALGTKSTVALALPAIALAAWAGPDGPLRARLRRLGGLAAACVAGVAVLGAPSYVDNLRRYGHPSGPAPFRDMLVLDRHTPQVVWANLARLTLRLLEPEGVAPPGPIGMALAQGYDALTGAVSRTLAVPLWLPDDDMPSEAAVWRPTPTVQISEDVTTFGPLFALVFVPALCIGMRRGPVGRALALGALAYLLLAAATLRFQIWHGRILLTFAALSAPLVASLLEGRARAAKAMLVAVIGLACQFTSGLYNVRKPLLGDAATWSPDPVTRRRTDAPRHDALLRIVEAVDPPIGSLGLVAEGPGVPRSPLFGRRLERRVETLLVADPPSFAVSNLSRFDAVLVTHESQTRYLEAWRPQSDRPWWTATDVTPLLDALRSDTDWQLLLDVTGWGHLFVRPARGIAASRLPDVLPIVGQPWADGWMGRAQGLVVRVDPERPRLVIEGETHFGMAQVLSIGLPGEPPLKQVVLPPMGPFRAAVSTQRLARARRTPIVPVVIGCAPSVNPKARGLSTDGRDLTVRVVRVELAAARSRAGDAEE